MSTSAGAAAIFVPVETPTALPLEDLFRSWVNSLSVIDRQRLYDHKHDPVTPNQVRELFKYAPLPEAAWAGDGVRRTFYPEPLLRALDLD